MKKKVILFTLSILLFTSIVTSADVSLGDTSSPTLHVNEENTGQSEYDGPDTDEIQWEFNTANKLQSTPTIGQDNVIYITDSNSATGEGFLYAIANDSTQLWNLSIGKTANSVTIGSDGNLFIGVDNGTFYAISPEGTIINTINLPNKISSTAAIVNNVIYITSVWNTGKEDFLDLILMEIVLIQL